MDTRLDHLVIAATTLEQGVEYVAEQLGVDIPKGGEHPYMGTHNHVMQLGNNTFLEVIAINPQAEPPERPRWFGLDDPVVRNSLKDQPRLLTWAINTSSLVDCQAQTDFDLGVITPVTRGELSWLFAVPEDGRLLAAGMVPSVLQWQTSSHPSERMADLNCRLRSVNIYHPYPQWLGSILDGLHVTDMVNLHSLDANAAPYMTAEIDTVRGVVVLDSVVSTIKR